MDANDPTNVLTDPVTVTCTTGEGWTPVSDFVIGAGGVVTISMDTADNTPFPGVNAQSLVPFDRTWLFSTEVTIEDASIARFDKLESDVLTNGCIVPLKPGETSMTITVTDEFYGGTKTQTLKLVVTDDAAIGVISNEQGASYTYLEENDAYYSQLDLVTEWLDGDAAQKPYNTVIASVDGVTGAYVYDIHLAHYGTDEEAPVLEGDTVTVTLPIPEGLSANGLHVFHVADDGAVTDMGAVVDAEGKYVSFTTSHFSTFVLAQVRTADSPSVDEGTQEGNEQPAEETPTTKPADGNAVDSGKGAIPATGDAGCVTPLVAAASGAAALIGGSIVRKLR